MKLITYKNKYRESLGIVVNGQVYDLHACDPFVPDTMDKFLKGGSGFMELARIAEGRILSGRLKAEAQADCTLLSPLPRPASCRDAYAFRQHVETARHNRGLPMIAEFDQYPVFYFTNHQAIFGPGEIRCMPDHFNKLDFELEAAIVIGKKGRNINAAAADTYIAGYLIMNDFSARTLQMEEMMLSLGPAKGKDFATAIGPWLVTPDELEPYKISTKPGHTGNRYNLTMTCKVNGREVSRGNLKDMDWTFAEIIERTSYGCDLYPGDVIGSGTVGSGCFLELNGTGLLNDASYKAQWLQPGDTVELAITALGTLANTIVAEDTGWSILNLKKHAGANL